MYKDKSDEVWETNQFIHVIITCDVDVIKHVTVSVFEDKGFEESKMLIKIICYGLYSVGPSL